MRNSDSRLLKQRGGIEQPSHGDGAFRSPYQQMLRALASTIALVLGGSLLVSCGDGAVAAENANPQVVFDGTSCIYDGPTKIEHGGIEFTLTNDSTTAIHLFALLYDDPADYQAELDSLAVGADADVTLTEVPDGLHFGLNLDAQPGQQATTLTILNSGKYILQCGHVPTAERFPDHLWRAATFEIMP